MTQAMARRLRRTISIIGHGPALWKRGTDCGGIQRRLKGAHPRQDAAGAFIQVSTVDPSRCTRSIAGQLWRHLAQGEACKRMGACRHVGRQAASPRVLLCWPCVQMLA